MKRHFYIHLSAIMIIFALVISLTLATYNYIKMKQEAISYQHNIMEEKANMLLYALETSDKANMLFGENLAKMMEEHTLYLQQLYDSKHLFENWDFKQLSEQLKMDIFIINDNNEIIYSNLENDIGLNFNECCQKLARVLDDRRETGQFYDDGIDVEQSTGIPKKYSYMSTYDKKYIIQLGFSWEEYEVFQEFNFLNVIDELKSDIIYDIHVLNIGGLPLGVQDHEYDLSGERRQAFENTLANNITSKVNGQWDNQEAVYFYIPYQSKYDQGTTQNKVLEIIYSQHELNLILSKNKQAFTVQILIILFITIILATLIAKRVAKPIHMAFHDSLTNLGNRAFYQEYMEKLLMKKQPAALMMIDLDNFKQVNDTYGHDDGDKLLTQTANIIKEIIPMDKGYAFRLGGDEFIVVILTENVEEVRQTAECLLKQFKKQIASTYKLPKSLSLSIGVALAPAHGADTEALTKHADSALYHSKNLGKNQYILFNELCSKT